MLRNVADTKFAHKLLQTKCRELLQQPLQPQLHFSTDYGARYAQNTGLQRQGKIMRKLFGDRLTGSKKRWYPTPDAAAHQPAGAIFQASQLGKMKSGSGKNTTRRMTVLNKLFMKHITDLLATGEASEAILGRGLQVSRVKISNDFACINVYWMGSGEATTDALLEQELRRCSGLLRHELSQLSLMGQVPRISFVRERTLHNLAQVESLLQNMDFGKEDDEDAETTAADEQQERQNHVRGEFYGKSTSTEGDVEKSCTETLPEMRHDVLGLDHRDIMSTILTKMRKTKQAWDVHNQMAAHTPAAPAETGTALERVTQKLAESAANSETFDKFLIKRRERKQQQLDVERKKYRNIAVNVAEVNLSEALEAADDVISTRQRRLYDEEDFIYDEHDNERRKS